MRILRLALLPLASLFLGAGCDDKDDTVNVPAELVVTKTDISLPADGGTATFALRSSREWVIECAENWVVIDPLKGEAITARNISVSAEPNASTVQRKATITVLSAGESKTIAVVQETGDYLSVSPSTFDLADADAGTFDVTVAANGETVITVNAQWISLKNEADGKLTFAYERNISLNRTGTITISCGSKTVEVVVNQPSGLGAADMSMTATQIAAAMYAGINIGNTLECCDNVNHTASEGSWGTGKVNETYIRGLKKMGFNAVRIPCAWDYYIIDKKKNTLDPKWLDRVAEVVGYCVSNDMFCFVNIHWDGGWLEETVAKGYDEAVNQKQHDLWTQIARRLADFDYHVLFASCNEPGQQDQGAIGSTQVNALKVYEQTFVDAVRATGGNNAKRCLIIQAPYTNIGQATNGNFTMPNDVVEERLLVEVHFYDPVNFCLLEKDADWGKASWYWGQENFVAGSDRNSTWGDLAHIKSEFSLMKRNYTDKGIPGVVGEYGSAIKTTSNSPGLDVEKHMASRAAWNEAVTREAKNAGLVPFYWETGGDINRSNGEAKNAYAIDGLMRGAAEGKYPFAK